MVRGVTSFSGSLGNSRLRFVGSFRFLVRLEIVGCGSWGHFVFWFACKQSHGVRGVISISSSLGIVKCSSWGHFVFWFAWKLSIAVREVISFASAYGVCGT